jgi:hypothetical protein
MPKIDYVNERRPDGFGKSASNPEITALISHDQF